MHSESLDVRCKNRASIHVHIYQSRLQTHINSALLFFSLHNPQTRPNANLPVIPLFAPSNPNPSLPPSSLTTTNPIPTNPMPSNSASTSLI